MITTLTIILIITLILLLVLITLYYFGYFSYKPSDYPPFNEVVDIFEPKMLKEAKKDYNATILDFFRVINEQSEVLTRSNYNDYKLEIHELMLPTTLKLQRKYTPKVWGKLFKYFACKHLRILLDNYYTGPPINMFIPDIPSLHIESFPFIYKSKTIGKIVNASTLAPFKYFIYNIPIEIKDEFTKLYNNMMDKYADILNKTFSKLEEVNINTIRSIDFKALFTDNESILKEDLSKIEILFGKNYVKILRKIFNKNILPLLDNFYKGPGINLSGSINVANNPQIITINYPNKDKKSIFVSTPGLIITSEKKTNNSPLTNTIFSKLSSFDYSSVLSSISTATKKIKTMSTPYTDSILSSISKSFNSKSKSSSSSDSD
jgi:hypothetical protein